MTIGEKIKYFRTKKGITQNKLAELCGIHPVSIRKYETNAMVPQQAQIERIAQALDLNTIALTGTEKLKLDTAGNVMSAMLLLINSGILKVDWEDKPFGTLDVSSVKITINPVFSSFLSVGNSKDDTTTDLNDLFFNVTKSNMFSDLLSYCVKKDQQAKEIQKGKTAQNDEFFKMSQEQIENLENWLQSDSIPFDELISNDLEIHDKEKNDIIKSKK